MAKPCSICIHDKVTEINEAVLSGKSLTQVAKEFGVSKDALKRHNANDHVPIALMKSSEVIETVQAENLFKRIEELETEVAEFKAMAIEQNNYRVALTCIDRQTKLIELYGKMKLLAMKGAELGRQNDDPPIWQQKVLVNFLGGLMERFPIIEVDVMVGLMALEEVPEGQVWVTLPDTYDKDTLQSHGYWNDTIKWKWEQREEILGDLAFRDVVSAMHYPLYYPKGYRDKQYHNQKGEPDDEGNIVTV